jgi:hypothetical protein
MSQRKKTMTPNVTEPFIWISAEALLTLTPGGVLVPVLDAVGPEAAPENRTGVRGADHPQGRVVDPPV